MDINEIKTWAKNKIESDALARQVRKRIKETTWEKQNQREGFRESFKPLISQFEKPEDYDNPFKKEEDKTKNIFTQNQEMLKNQLALTEGVRANRRAITDGLRKLDFLEHLANMQELPGAEAIEDNEQFQAAAEYQAPPPPPDDENCMFNLVNRFKGHKLQKLKEMGYDNPNDFLKKDMDYLESYYNDANDDANGKIAGKGKKKKKTQQDINYIKKLKSD